MTPASPHRILVIDDNAAIHDDFRKVLLDRPATPDLDALEAAIGEPVEPVLRHGFDIDSADQGQAGVAMAKAALREGRPYAVAFVDMRMPPGWDGVQTIEQLWLVDPEVQVVICTAYSDHPWEQVMARLDVRDRLLVLKKPFDLVEVGQLARTLAAKWQATRQAAQQIAEMRASHAELEELMHSLAHDLGAPLIAMRSFSQLLARELAGAGNARALHYLDRIQANSTLSSQMIDGLLRLDRVMRAPLQPEPLDLGALAHEVFDELQGVDAGRRASLTVQDGLRTRADRNLTRHALRELLGNARKFSPPEKAARIEVGGEPGPDGRPVYFVRDNGIGFEMAYASQLFRSFQRLQSDRSLAGTGMGLVTVSRIIARQGGRVWAESSPGLGSTFYFTLPATDAGPSPETAPGRS